MEHHLVHYCKPFIISDLEWSYELLYEVECVCRVDVKNAEQICHEIIRLISDAQFSERITKNSLKMARKYFDYKTNMAKMESIMCDIVKKH